MIAIDWGTSSFRAYRLRPDGTVRDRRSAALGLLACKGAFAQVLAEQIDGWDDGAIVMAGMIGSRNGWIEAPYADGPVDAAALAAGLCAVTDPALGGRTAWIVPGVACHVPGAPPEVMRGEETQVMGLLDALPGPGPHWVCLPGTHSKWVRVEDGRIVSVSTAMTGELYALLRARSLLAALMPEPGADADDPEAFVRGVVASAAPGGVLKHLFGVRTLGLFEQLPKASAPSYLSGLLIGHELRDLLPQDVGIAHLVGSDALVRRYAGALDRLGVTTRSHGEALCARGLFLLAAARGLRD